MRGRLCGLVVAALCFAGEREAFACSCEVSGPPCEATWRVDAVFSGTVLSTEPEQVTPGEPYRTIVRFAVERGFLNSPSGTAEIVTGMGGGDCGYRFEAGVKYLVYASKTGSSRLTAGICSRTRPLSDAAEDLKYLSTIGAEGTGGRVYGRVHESRRHPADEQRVDYGPVEGITVSVRGPSLALNAVTDAHGAFEFTRLPTGKVTFTLFTPFGFEPRTFEREIELADPRACSQVDLSIYQAARASGSVVDASGHPVAGVAVDVVAAELAGFDPPEYRRKEKTNERGVFEFTDLPPGAYVFGVNLTKPLYGSRKGKPLFLPGTALPSEATIVDVRAGDTLGVGVLRLADR